MSDKFPGGLITAGAPAGFSVAFDGSGDYLTAASSSNLTLGTGDFTIEAWIYPINWTNSSASVVRGNGVTNSPAFAKVDATSFFGIANEGVAWIISDAALPTVNTWSHVAVTRSGTTVKIFINGTQSGSTATSSVDFTNPIRTIGTNSGSDAFFTGYISNVRVLKGTALYTTTFTPPTQMFPITNTQLLACQSPTIIDNSSNALAITVSGNAAVSNFTPFAGYTGFNPALGAAAGGVWTLDEAAYYQNNRQWPIYDPYFNQTTLMLHGNGTNGAQNNTFLDSSTNNFTITRNGNTTQGSFSPFSQTGWSNNFASSAALSVDYTANLQLQNTNWTIEAYFNLSSASAEFCVMGASNGGGGVPKYFMGGNWSTAFGYNANRATFFTYTAGGNRFIDVPFTWEIGRWYHMAAVYTHSNTTVTLYINGVSVGSIAYGIDSCTGAVLIARNGEGGGILTGYISNFRYMVGTSLYTSNFTPSTQPLTALTNTQILTCQSNRFVDNSASNRVINIFAAGVSAQAFSPFVPAYITPTTYSNYFDGSTGYLSFTSSAGIAFGTGDYTVEAWVNLTSSSTYQTLFGSATSDALMFNIYSMNSVVIQTSGTNIFATFSGATFATNTWYHVAVSRSSGTVKAFVNGVQYGSTITSNTTNYAQPTTNTIGSNAASQYFGGCLSNLRLVKGTAVYTAAFTPPTAPLTAITNTVLLTCQNSTFIDNSASPFTLTATGSVKPVDSPTPFPAKVDTTTLNSAYSTSLIGGSGYFDGTGDYLTAPDNAAFAFGTGNFTIELFAYRTNSPSGVQMLSAQTDNASAAGTSYTVYLNTNTIESVVYSGSTAYTVTSSGFVTSTWTHLAVVRSGSTLSLFVNGAVVSTTSIGAASVNDAAQPISIAARSNGTDLFTGYISGFRIVKGTALYTSNFAPPTTPLTNVTNTSLLTNFTNGAIFDNTAKNVLETVGNAQISTAQSKYGGSSMAFDGTGDYLLLQGGQNFTFGTGDFTIEMWIYVNSGLNTDIVYYDGRPTSTNGLYNIIYTNSTGKLVYSTNSADRITGTTTLSTGTWYHIALSRSGTSTKLFLNGTQEGSTYTDSNSYIVGANRPVIAGNGFTLGNAPLNGYIDDLRVTKYARYVTNFTPPTSQLQDQ